MGALSVSISLNYWIVIPLTPLVISMLYTRKYYLSTSTEIKRLDCITKSPVFIHVNHTLNGMATIRAASMQPTIMCEFHAHTDYHTRTVSTFLFVNRWFAIRLDWLITVYIYLAVFSCILLKSIS
jgi:hypothetical protein